MGPCAKRPSRMFREKREKGKTATPSFLPRRVHGAGNMYFKPCAELRMHFSWPFLSGPGEFVQSGGLARPRVAAGGVRCLHIALLGAPHGALGFPFYFQRFKKNRGDVIFLRLVNSRVIRIRYQVVNGQKQKREEEKIMERRTLPHFDPARAQSIAGPAPACATCPTAACG